MTTYALCMGVSDYSQWRAVGLDVPDLPCSVKNAEDFSQVLSTGFGVDPSRIGIQRDAWCSSGNVVRAIHDLIQKAIPGDSLCVFFSGHGTRVQGLPSAGGDSGSNLWYEALVPHSGSLVTDYDLAILTSKLDASRINLTFVLDTANTGGLRPVPGAPSPIGVAIADGLRNSFVQYCHTLVPVGLCLENPMTSIAGNTRGIQFENNRYVIDFPQSSYSVEAAKGTVITACAADELAWQAPALKNSIFVAAWKNVVNTGSFTMSHPTFLKALQTEADRLMTQNVRKLASYARQTSVPQIYGAPARLSGNVLAAQGAGVAG